MILGFVALWSALLGAVKAPAAYNPPSAADLMVTDARAARETGASVLEYDAEQDAFPKSSPSSDGVSYLLPPPAGNAAAPRRAAAYGSGV